MHATIVRLDEATQAEFSGIRKNPDVGADDPRCAGRSAGDPTGDSAGTARMVQAVGAAQHRTARVSVARATVRDFARRIGVTDQSSAYHLVHLHRYRAQIISRCVDDAAAAAKRGQIYRYPGWETALGWFHPTKRRGGQRSGRYWLTPPALWRKLDAEFHFDYDPCPYPLPKGCNALIGEWGQSNYVNPPFRQGAMSVGGSGANRFRPQGDLGAARRARPACWCCRSSITSPYAAGCGCRDTAAGASAFPRRGQPPGSPTSTQHRRLYPPPGKADDHLTQENSRSLRSPMRSGVNCNRRPCARRHPISRSGGNLLGLLHRRSELHGERQGSASISRISRRQRHATLHASPWPAVLVAARCLSTGERVALWCDRNVPHPDG